MAQLFAGLFKATWDEESSDSEDSGSDSDNDEMETLTSDFATPLSGLTTTVNSECAASPRAKTGEFETLATPAIQFDINVPDDYTDGQKIPVPGPHGTIEIVPPSGAKPGETLKFRVKPPSDLRVTVPPKVSAGQTMIFESTDKSPSKISVKVPKGLKPGDVFEITPPSVMVLVPKNANVGDTVLFQAGGKWCRTKIPENIELGHFAARLPKPQDSRKAKGPSSPKGGA